MQDTINMPAQKINIWAETSMQDTPVHKHANTLSTGFSRFFGYDIRLLDTCQATSDKEYKKRGSNKP